MTTIEIARVSSVTTIRARARHELRGGARARLLRLAPPGRSFDTSPTPHRGSPPRRSLGANGSSSARRAAATAAQRHAPARRRRARGERRSARRRRRAELKRTRRRRRGRRSRRGAERERGPRRRRGRGGSGTERERGRRGRRRRRRRRCCRRRPRRRDAVWFLLRLGGSGAEGERGGARRAVAALLLLRRRGHPERKRGRRRRGVGRRRVRSLSRLRFGFFRAARAVELLQRVPEDGIFVVAALALPRLRAFQTARAAARANPTVPERKTSTRRRRRRRRARVSESPAEIQRRRRPGRRRRDARRRDWIRGEGRRVQPERARRASSPPRRIEISPPTTTTTSRWMRMPSRPSVDETRRGERVSRGGASRDARLGREQPGARTRSPRREGSPRRRAFARARVRRRRRRRRRSSCRGDRVGMRSECRGGVGRSTAPGFERRSREAYTSDGGSFVGRLRFPATPGAATRWFAAVFSLRMPTEG